MDSCSEADARGTSALPSDTGRSTSERKNGKAPPTLSAYIGIPDDLRHRERRIVVLLNEFNRPEQRRRIPGDPDAVLDMTLQAQNQKIGQRLHRINHIFPRQLLNVGKPVGNDRIPRNVNLPETVSELIPEKPDNRYRDRKSLRTGCGAMPPAPHRLIRHGRPGDQIPVRRCCSCRSG